MSELLRAHQHWVFDMDGTLTVDAHDFEYVRQQLGLPSGSDILAELAKLPATEAQSKHQWLQAYEAEVAANSVASPGVQVLLLHLVEQQAQIAVVTRNTKALAHITLAAIGVEHLLADTMIFGRECAPPKPDPYLLHQLARQWSVPAQRLVMVGDFHFDLRFARAANARSVLVNTPDNLWPELTDHYYPTLKHLLAAIR